MKEHFTKIDLKSVTPGTWARLALLLASFAGSIADALGVTFLPLENGTVQTVISSVITVSVSLLCYWKNNSFTKAAELADKIMENLKTE